MKRLYFWAHNVKMSNGNIWRSNAFALIRALQNPLMAALSEPTTAWNMSPLSALTEYNSEQRKPHQSIFFIRLMFALLNAAPLATPRRWSWCTTWSLSHRDATTSWSSSGARFPRCPGQLRPAALVSMLIRVSSARCVGHDAGSKLCRYRVRLRRGLNPAGCSPTTQEHECESTEDWQWI